MSKYIHTYIKPHIRIHTYRHKDMHAHAYI